MPPRGPRSVLCVVVVTTCACGSGLGCDAAGDQPGEMRHVDHQIGADLVGDRAEAGEIDDPRIGAAAGDDQLRPVRLGQALDLVEIDAARRRRARRRSTALNHLPEMFGGAPCVRCPPAASDMPRIVSPGCSSARNTAWLACAPECGWTLAKPQSNRRLARSIASALGDVDELAAAVIAPAGIALGVFVGQHRALRLEHGARDDVLAGDQLDLRLLAVAARCAIAAAISGSAAARSSPKNPAPGAASATEAGAWVREHLS